MTTKPRSVTIDIYELAPGDVRWAIYNDVNKRTITDSARWRDGMPSANVANALHEAADAAHHLLWNEGAV
tara:strand:- start:17 stop:226 length:210 start_codon:yes stop_codon:yes gene_type:complete